MLRQAMHITIQTLWKKASNKSEFFRDSQGRKLDIYPRGKYLNTKGYWLIGTNDKKSWDSS